MGTWDYYGTHEPHYGIVSWPEHRQAVLDADQEAAFWASGEAWVQQVWATVQAHVCPTFAPATALDFGCGIGRVLVPLAGRGCSYVGVDVSRSMLRRAMQTVQGAGATRGVLVHASDAMQIADQYDLVHSSLVLQHIPPREGWRWLRWLAERVTPGGVLAVQLLIGDRRPRWRRAVTRLVRVVPGARGLRNWTQGRPWREPVMPMYVYRLGQVQAMLTACGYPTVVVVDYPHAPWQAVTVYGQRVG